MIAIIQARIDSTRFPRKVLKKIAKKSLIEIVYKRLKKLKKIKKVVVCIPDDKQNLILEKKLKYLKIPFFKGSNADVLKRYYDTAKKYTAKNIIRITSDCPLVDIGIVNKMMKIFFSRKADYISNNNPRTFPHGLDVEIFNMFALKEAFFKSTSKRDREHVTYYITRNKKKFKICNYENKINLSKFRVTVDYQEDLQVIRNIFKYFKPNIYFNFSDVKKLIQIKPKIFNKNAHLRKK
jgi:spore coat polysaccharide biosynthesis protein SpsF (cytidylyltransferase family)